MMMGCSLSWVMKVLTNGRNGPARKQVWVGWGGYHGSHVPAVNQVQVKSSSWVQEISN